jgi:hypothetical protein
MSKRLFLGVLLAIVAVVVLAAVWALRDDSGSSTRAEGGAVEMGIDPEVTGNTATSLGTLEYCVRVDIESPAFDNVSDYVVDVYVKGDTQAPAGYDAWVTYDAGKVHIVAPTTDALLKLPGASTFTDAVPDSDGKFVASVGYLSGGPGTAGDGTLVRLGLDIGASGLVSFDFDSPGPAAAYYSPGEDQPVPHPVTRMAALLAINVDCPPGGRPEPSPTPDRAEATPTPVSAAELDRLRQEEAAKPKFEGTINGIRIYSPDASAEEWRKDACTDAKSDEVEHPDISELAGTPMDIVPTYLPLGAEETDPRSTPTVCKGTIAYTERRWGITGKGEFYVIRRQGEQAIDLDVPEGRISAATVAGKPAVLVAPIVEGYDYSVVVVADDIGITVVAGLLPLDEIVKIAEGLK